MACLGRDAETTAIVRALDATPNAVIILVGDHGVGKTRLAEAVIAEVADRYAIVPWHVESANPCLPGINVVCESKKVLVFLDDVDIAIDMNKGLCSGIVKVLQSMRSQTTTVLMTSTLARSNRLVSKLMNACSHSFEVDPLPNDVVEHIVRAHKDDGDGDNDDDDARVAACVARANGNLHVAISSFKDAHATSVDGSSHAKVIFPRKLDAADMRFDAAFLRGRANMLDEDGSVWQTDLLRKIAFLMAPTDG